MLCKMLEIANFRREGEIGSYSEQTIYHRFQFFSFILVAYQWRLLLLLAISLETYAATIIICVYGSEN